MRANSRWGVRIHNLVFVILLTALIGVTAWLSHQHRWQADWTAGNRNTLGEASRTLLSAMDTPITITAWVKDDPALHQRIKQRIARYQRFKPDLQLRFSNPELQPDAATQAGITRPGQLSLTTGERRETVENMSEQTLTNAMQRLVREGERRAVFLEGHNERSPFAEDNQGLSQVHNMLSRSGVGAQGINLIRTPTIPENTSMLVIAAPQSALLPGEVDLLRQYIADGGNLLWLQDPGELHGLKPLADEFGIRFVDGIIVDANQQVRQLMGIEHPAIVPVVNYGLHKATRDLKSQTLFPFAVGIDISTDTDAGWISEPLLVTLPRTWAEAGGLGNGNVDFDEQQGDRLGPLTLGVALHREHQDRQQRVVVIGDSDFIANSYVGNGQNLDLALNVFNWLSEDDDLISITVRGAPDKQLNLGYASLIAISFGFLLVLPLGLLACGFTIWFKRRRR